MVLIQFFSLCVSLFHKTHRCRVIDRSNCQAGSNNLFLCDAWNSLNLFQKWINLYFQALEAETHIRNFYLHNRWIYLFFYEQLGQRYSLSHQIYLLWFHHEIYQIYNSFNSMTENREKSESIPETEVEEPKFNDLWEGLYLLILSCSIIFKTIFITKLLLNGSSK